ncbi:alpha/beta hydrolase [Palleronia caenipelagi]|uniref:Alpha/beta hydrolase n=1 Tax=Palleronia caenipelagi TaxID=2489174 RepID=A0A547Q7Q6_9RHOB|nr:alpha/beta hydrolase [Palleronia caenipelagi]TRD22425.1 alpha/beta hydrolase [Palleronia caenipelagi]
MAKSEAKKREQREAWRQTLAEKADQDGFFREVGPLHKAIFIPQDGAMGKTLVVAFDNLDDVRQDPNRLPWAVDFISAQGWSSLGFMAHGPTWYRDEAVFDFFEELKADGFFDQFDRVAFYGTSMGGYAACAFSAVCPGATVLAVNPQACMDRDRAGWDHRYRRSWRHDYYSRYGYAPDMVKDAEKAWIFYDSRMPQDAMHAALFQSPNVIRVGCPFMGHGMLNVWRDMGILKQLVSGCINGTLSRVDVYRMLRARHDSKIYQKNVLRYLMDEKDSPRLLIRFCRAIVKKRPAPHFRNAMNEALTRIGEPTE